MPCAGERPAYGTPSISVIGVAGPLTAVAVMV